MTTNTMIERVARALYCAQDGISLDANTAHVEYWFSESECAAAGDICVRAEYEAMARAAIEAMREPTPDATAAVERRLTNATTDNPKSDCWNWLVGHKAWIDHALSETGE